MNGYITRKIAKIEVLILVYKYLQSVLNIHFPCTLNQCYDIARYNQIRVWKPPRHERGGDYAAASLRLIRNSYLMRLSLLPP